MYCFVGVSLFADTCKLLNIRIKYIVVNDGRGGYMLELHLSVSDALLFSCSPWVACLNFEDAMRPKDKGHTLSPTPPSAFPAFPLYVCDANCNRQRASIDIPSPVYRMASQALRYRLQTAHAPLCRLGLRLTHIHTCLHLSIYTIFSHVCD